MDALCSCYSSFSCSAYGQCSNYLCALRHEHYDCAIYFLHKQNPKNPLLIACKHVTKITNKLIKYILENKITHINEVDENNYTALHFLCNIYIDYVFYKNIDSIELLLSYDPDINIKNNYGRTPLELFLNYIQDEKHIKRLKDLFNNHGSLEIKDPGFD
jgi:ankyrin repeat protein